MGVFAKTHDHHGAHNLTFTIQFGNTTSELRTQPNLCNIFQSHRCTFVIHTQGYFLQVGNGCQVAGCPDHVFGLTHLNHRTADLLVTPFDRVTDLGDGEVIGLQRIRVDHHLVLLNHAANGGDLGYPGDRLQFKFQEPVLYRAQLGKVMFPCPVNQCVFVDPADTGCVRTQCGFGGRREISGHLVQVLEYPGARPVKVGAVLKNDIDK